LAYWDSIADYYSSLFIQCSLAKGNGVMKPCRAIKTKRFQAGAVLTAVVAGLFSTSSLAAGRYHDYDTFLAYPGTYGAEKSWRKNDAAYSRNDCINGKTAAGNPCDYRISDYRYDRGYYHSHIRPAAGRTHYHGDYRAMPTREGSNSVVEDPSITPSRR
jgi:hypothetical protein